MTVTVQDRKKRTHAASRKGPDVRVVKLLLCAVLFGAALIVKTASPSDSQLRAAVLGWIESGPAYSDIVETLGRAVTDPDPLSAFFGEGIVRAFGLDPNGTSGSEAEGEPALDGDPPDGYDGADADSAAGGTTAPEGAAVNETGESPVPDTLGGNLEAAGSQPAASAYDGTSAAVPEFELSEEDIADDTPAEDFEIPPPDIVLTDPVSIDFAYVTPVVGPVSSPFGYRDHPLDGNTKFHYGVDIAASEGTPILCFAAGKVIEVGVGTINGNYFKVQHADGIVSMYAHCQKVLVKKGATVKKGQKVALVGKTGQASGSHLHFQIYKDGRIIDPTPFLTTLS